MNGTTGTPLDVLPARMQNRIVSARFVPAVAALVAVAVGSCGSAPVASQSDVTGPAPSVASATSAGAPTNRTEVTVPGLPRFAGDQDTFCRQAVVATWSMGMTIARADPVGDPSTGCVVRYDYFDGTPGYVIAARRDPGPADGWVYGPTGDADEVRSTSASGSTWWIDPTGPDTRARLGVNQGVVLRPDGRLFVAAGLGQGAPPLDALLDALDRTVGNAARTSVDLARVTARRLDAPFSASPLSMQPAPAGVVPHLETLAVAQAARLLFSWFDVPGARLEARFGLYSRTNPDGGASGAAVPAWLLIFTGLTFVPSCPATTPPSAAPVPGACGPSPGYAMDVISDADGTLLFGEFENGGDPPNV